MDEFESLPDETARASFEESLADLVPRAEPLSREAVLYRCGWEAAMATERSPINQRPVFKWKSFGMGNVTGIAACALLLLGWNVAVKSSLPASPSVAQQRIDRAESSQDDHRSVKDSEAAPQGDVVHPTADQIKQSDAPVSHKPPTRSVYTQDAPLITSEGLRRSGLLSPAARAQWQMVLTTDSAGKVDASTLNSSARPSFRKPSSRAELLGEFL